MKPDNTNLNLSDALTLRTFALADQHDQQFLLAALLNNLPTGISVFGPTLDMLACNGKFKELLDFPEHLFAEGLPSLPRLIHFNAARGEYGPGDPDCIAAEMLARATCFEPSMVERTRPNGMILRMRRNPLPGGGYLATYADVTEQRTTERALAESEKRFRGAFETAAIGMALVSMDGHWLKVNQALSDMLGYSASELQNMTFQDITHPSDIEADLGHVRDLVAGAITYYHMEKRYFHKNRHVVWVLLSVSLVRDGLGSPIHFVAQVEDITDRKRSEEQAFHLAHHDILTGLPNRRLLKDRLTQAIARACRFKHPIAVMFLDLDHFKKINDVLGHDAGDTLLRQMAGRLLACVRSVDTVCRLGGDEFVIVLADIAASQDAAVVAKKVLKSVCVPFEIHEQILHVTASIGISVSPGNVPDEPEELMKKADIAMYRAKEAGRNQYCFSE